MGITRWRGGTLVLATIVAAGFAAFAILERAPEAPQARAAVAHATTLAPTAR